MKIDYPAPQQLSQLRQLWQSAFHDDDAYMDMFFEVAFASARCRGVTQDGQVAAALYWFDCRLEGRPIAYLFAVATGKKFRRQGLCRRLMEDTHRLLKELGYCGSVLVPGDVGLFAMYFSMGYLTCSNISTFRCDRGGVPAKLRPLEPAEYAALRRQYLPEGGVIQENEALALLKGGLYAGEDFLYADGQELLGNTDAAPAILAALGRNSDTFRTPGNDRPFAMFRAIGGTKPPKYFGLALD